VSPLTIALLKGLLTPILKENINYINAPILAKERGIRVVESKSSESKDYKSMITLRVKTSKDEGLAEGAIFGRRDPRIVKINEFRLDAIPEGHMILVYNYDKPGVIGNIGTTLGNSGINIARLHLGREKIEGKALVVLSTDSRITNEALKELRELPHVISITRIEM
jgi:D-3-phosphoglycerate dehydrogenase